MKGVGSLFLNHDISLNWGDGGMDFPSWSAMCVGVSTTAIVLDVDDWCVCRARFGNQVLDFCEEFVSLVYGVGF